MPWCPEGVTSREIVVEQQNGARALCLPTKVKQKAKQKVCHPPQPSRIHPSVLPKFDSISRHHQLELWRSLLIHSSQSMLAGTPSPDSQHLQPLSRGCPAVMASPPQRLLEYRTIATQPSFAATLFPRGPTIFQTHLSSSTASGASIMLLLQQRPRTQVSLQSNPRGVDNNPGSRALATPRAREAALHQYAAGNSRLPARRPTENPTGTYRRTVRVPSTWDNTWQLRLRFDGVDSAYHVRVNDNLVGYNQGSRNPSKFDITAFVPDRDASFQVSVTVYQWSDGSYLENQDEWCLSGLLYPFRESIPNKR